MLQCSLVQSANRLHIAASLKPQLGCGNVMQSGASGSARASAAGTNRGRAAFVEHR